MNNFTLIIPTHNRHSYLKRSIEYFKNLEAKVIYCDSSLKSYNDKLHSNIEYIHLPKKNFAEKILIALEKINTPFIALCADDDFILLDSLYKGFGILNTNINFATILGNNIEFLKIFDFKFYTNHVFPEYKLIGSSEQKVMKLFSNYRQFLWGIYKKKILIDTFEIIKKANFTNDNFYEMVIGTISTYNGDVMFLNDIWSIREYSHDNHWATRHKVLYYYKQDSEIKKDIKTFINIVNQYTKKGIAEIALENYLNMSFRLKFVFFIKYYTYKVFPNWFISFFRSNNIKNQYLNTINYKSFPDLLVIFNILKKTNVKNS